MRHGVRSVTAAPGRVLRNVSLATRLSMVVVIVALVSVVCTSYVGLQRGRELADDVLRDRVSAFGTARGADVERYVAGLQRTVLGQAISPSTADAIGDLEELYLELGSTAPTRTDQNDVEDFYRDVVAPDLSKVRGRTVGASSLVPVSSAAITLQAEYVARAAQSELDTDGIPEWAEIHDPLHQSFRELVARAGVDDLYLIAPENEVVVYSVTKAIDFGTSLRVGPHSGSALAALVTTMAESADPGVASVRDFGIYAPAGDRPAAFVGSPVYAADELAGYLVVRFGPEELTAIMTNDGDWDAEGETGEAYLVAADGFVRSDSRRFIEDRAGYIDGVADAGTATEDQQRSMEVLGTTVLFQAVDTRDLDELFDGNESVTEVPNVVGRDVVSARIPLAIDDVQWAAFAEVEVAEVARPIDDFTRNLLIAIAVFIVVVTFLAVRWADRLLRPVRIISSRLRGLRDTGGTTDDAVPGDATVLPAHSASEFIGLGEDIDSMVVTLRQRTASAALRAAERRRVLRRILPPAIAERAEAGDRDVVEDVPVATVAVIVVHGLGAVMRRASADQARVILQRFVDDADDLAAERGLDRIRLTGDAYYAACGVTRLHLDHAARAVSFALDLIELIDDLDRDDRVTVTAGIDSGPMTVGLTGGTRLVHDTWGATVQQAADLARRAQPGEILVTEIVREHLPERFAVTTLADGHGVVSARTAAAGAPDEAVRPAPTDPQPDGSEATSSEVAGSEVAGSEEVRT